MKRMALGVVCVSALACGGPAIGDDQEPAKLFESLDKNSDGVLSDDEVGEDRKRFFERLVRVGDKNEDKKLSRDEFLAAITAEEKPVETPRQFGPRGGDRPMFSPGQMFERMDRNKDGKLAKSEIPEQAPPEMRERMERMFTAAGKSELTKEEFEKVMEKYGPPRGPEGRRPEGRRPEADGDRPRPDGERGREMAREGDRRPGPEGDRPRPDGDRPRPEADRMERGDGRPEGRGFAGGGFGGGFGGRPMSPLIRMLDRDENGKLNRRELARLADRFDELDRNEDGELDAQELLGFPFGGGGGGFAPFGGRPGFGGPDRGREMAREGERRPEPPRDGDRRPEARDGERRPEGPRDGDRPRPDGARDSDRPRPEGAREGDRPRPEGRLADRPEAAGPRGPGRDGGRPGELFARFDRNGDGKITPEEFRDALARESGAPAPERRERRPELEK